MARTHGVRHHVNYHSLLSDFAGQQPQAIRRRRNCTDHQSGRTRFYLGKNEMEIAYCIRK